MPIHGSRITSSPTCPRTLLPGVVHHVGRHARRRAGKGARLERQHDVAHDDAARDLGAAGVVDDRAAAAADGVEEPQPGRRVPRLAGARPSARRLDRSCRRTRLVAELHQRADQRRRDAQRGHAVALHQLPQPVHAGIVGRAVVEQTIVRPAAACQTPPTAPSSSPCRSSSRGCPRWRRSRPRAMSIAALIGKPQWVCTAPLGWPVVPEV